MDDERDVSSEEPMPVDTNEHAIVFNNIESLVYEATDATCSGEHDLRHITVDGNDLFDLEKDRIARFVTAGCKCKLVNGNPCCQLFSPSMYRSIWDKCCALTGYKLDLVVMEQL